MEQRSHPGVLKKSAFERMDFVQLWFLTPTALLNLALSTTPRSPAPAGLAGCRFNRFYASKD